MPLVPLEPVSLEPVPLVPLEPVPLVPAGPSEASELLFEPAEPVVLLEPLSLDDELPIDPLLDAPAAEPVPD